ncbi:hydrolase [Gordonia phage Evaa]|nr:hydrolase [Gordonia phage Evaa]
MIRTGSTPIIDIRRGATPLSQVRVGSTLVWSRSSVRDDFERDDSVGLGPNWTSHGPSATPYLASVLNGYARMNVPDGLVNLSLQTNRQRFNAGVVAGDNGYIEARIANLGDAGWSRISQLFGRLSNAAFTHGVGFQLSDGRLHIVRRVADTDTIMASGSGYAAGDVIRLAYAGNVYSLYRNGSYVFGWTDSGNSASVGSAFRSLGLVVSATKDTFGPRRYSPAFDYVEAA